MNEDNRSRPKKTAVGEQRLLPLSVWLCCDAETYGQAGAVGGEKVCDRHRMGVGRELARHLIEGCTRQGGTVGEVFTNSESVLVTAAEAGRRVVGCVPHLPLAQHLRGKLRRSLPAERRGAVRLRPFGPRDLAEAMAVAAGGVDLLIAALPPYLGKTAGAAPTTCRSCVSEQKVEMPPLDRLLKDAAAVLSPGGHLAVITGARYEPDRRVDPAPEVIGLAERSGLVYRQHVIALRVPVEGDTLVVEAGPQQLAQLRKPASATLPQVVSVHADVCLFTLDGSRGDGLGGGR